MANILIATPWCPNFIYSIITQNIKLHEKVLKYIFFLWATEMSRTVKQPIRAELNIIIHDPVIKL